MLGFTIVVSTTFLEIRVLSFEHEQFNRLLADMFTLIAVEMELEFTNAGSTTFLEIRVLSFEHEQFNRLLADMFTLIAVEMELEFTNAGSTTFNCQDLTRGFEPDTCFYIQHAADIEGKKRIDLATDPPPDLVIEVDITSPSLDKLPIYAAVGFREVWHFDGGRIAILTGSFR